MRKQIRDLTIWLGPLNLDHSPSRYGMTVSGELEDLVLNDLDIRPHWSSRLMPILRIIFRLAAFTLFLTNALFIYYRFTGGETHLSILSVAKALGLDLFALCVVTLSILDGFLCLEVGGNIYYRIFIS